MPGTTCEAHDQTPAEDYRDNHACYGELWRCTGCGRWVCAGYGAADKYPDLCDRCAVENFSDKTLASSTVIT